MKNSLHAVVAFFVLLSFNNATAKEPVITLNGNSDTTINVYHGYQDEGVTAFDVEDGDLTSSVVVNTYLDTSFIGDYYIKYYVTDTDGNQTVVTRSVKVRDLEKPKITYLGEDSSCVGLNIPHKSSDVTAKDNYDTRIGSAIRYSTNIDVTKMGTYWEKFWATDFSGNTSDTLYTTVIVSADCTPPALTLIGAADTTILQYSIWSDPGAVAFDMNGNDLSSKITVTGYVDTRKARDQFKLQYSVSDTHGNTSMIERRVTILAPCYPIIRVQSDTIQIDVNYPYNAYSGVYDISCNSEIHVTNNVNPFRLGSYNATYTTTSYSGHSDTADIVVQVVDLESPTIRSKSGPIVKIAKNDVYDPRDHIILSDNYDAPFDLIKNLVVSYNDVDVNTEGVYSTVFRVTDLSGNMSKKFTLFTSVEASILSLQTINDKQSVKIYPNPSSESFTVESETDKQISGIRMYSCLGQLVYAENFSNYKVTIKQDSIPKGLYTLEILMNEESSFRKLIIE